MFRFRQTVLNTAGALAALLVATSLAAAQEIVALATREGVTQSFLLLAPEKSKPAAVAVLFPGGQGNINLRSENGEIKFAGGNFLVRSRQMFVDGGVAVAVMDAPSDEARGMDDRFRLGEMHAGDIAAVVADLKKRYAGAPIFLVGTSRGTISAASAGRTLADGVAGVVLTSSLFLAARSGPGLSGFDFSTIKAPVLFVHHVDDSCRFTPYSSAKTLAARFPLISVTGGKPATSDPCEAFSAHGYLGKEAETVDAVVNWMLKKPYRNNID